MGNFGLCGCCSSSVLTNVTTRRFTNWETEFQARIVCYILMDVAENGANFVHRSELLAFFLKPASQSIQVGGLQSSWRARCVALHYAISSRVAEPNMECSFLVFGRGHLSPQLSNFLRHKIERKSLLPWNCIVWWFQLHFLSSLSPSSTIDDIKFRNGSENTQTRAAAP